MDVIAFLSDSIFTSPMFKRVWQVWLGVLYCSASLLVMPSMNAIGANAKLYEILGPEFRLANQEAQRLHEKAEELFYRAEYVASFSALESALVIVEAERLSKRDSATILTTMAELHGVLGNRSEAVKKENQALQIAEKELGSEHPVTARVWRAIAASRVMDGDMTAAQDALDRFFAVVGKHYGTNHEGAAMNPCTPESERPSSTQLRKAVSGGSHKACSHYQEPFPFGRFATLRRNVRHI